jgi:hypothetical protein
LYFPLAQSLAESLDGAVRCDDPYFNKLIRIMATRCMTQAVYLSSGERLLAACTGLCVWMCAWVCKQCPMLSKPFAVGLVWPALLVPLPCNSKLRIAWHWGTGLPTPLFAVCASLPLRRGIGA